MYTYIVSKAPDRKAPIMANARIQVKADGIRTRTYSYSNMGWDNAATFAHYLLDCGSTNIRLIERDFNGNEKVTEVTDYLTQF